MNPNPSFRDDDGDEVGHHIDESAASGDQEDPNAAKKEEFEAQEAKKEGNLKIFTATTCILLLQLCERVSYYSIVGNMVLFCTSILGYDTVEATTISLMFAGFVYLMPVPGGYISDAWTGRYATMLLSCVFIVVGLVLLIVSAINFEDWFQGSMSQTGKRACFIASLVLTALGTGGIKANVSPFGAEQVQILGSKAVNSFFNWFYWVTAVGSVVAYTGVAYIQQNVSFVWGYVTSLVVFLIGMILYLVAKPLYTTSKPEVNALKTFFSVLRQGLCRHRSSRKKSFVHRDTPEQPELPYNSIQRPSAEKYALLDMARCKYGGTHDDATVNGVLSVVTVLPLCGLVIMFWAIYSQTQSSFFVQAVRMDVRVGDFKIPAAMLGSFTNLSIVLIIPILDRVVYPCLIKIGFPLTMMRRVGLGLIFSTSSVVVAGIVEIFRKEYLKQDPHVQNLANQNFTASSLSVFVQTPQFILIGVGEVFTAATTLEIGYTQAPPCLQGLLTGLFYAASAIGNFLSMGIMLVIKEATSSDPWWGNEINDIKMENLMFLLAGLTLLDFILFCLLAYRYARKSSLAASRSAQTDQLGPKRTSI